MAYLSLYRGVVESGKIKINTNGKPFLIREIRNLPFTSQKYSIPPSFSHADLVNADFHLKSGANITVHDLDTFSESDTFNILLSIF